MSPGEGLILAHQPVNGATYTAAKLTHLIGIVLYLVPAINALPAVGGLLLKDSRWSYPFIHLSAALGTGCVVALLCCALYGWLVRLLPARRLRAAVQLAGMAPFLLFMASGPLARSLGRIDVRSMLPATPLATWALAFGSAAAALAIVALGIRSLSADYLIRVSSITRGSAQGSSRARRLGVGELTARIFRGQPARAGFDFVCRMMRRDFQFRRQIVIIGAVAVIELGRSVVRGWQTDPLSGRFTSMHLFPHLIGFLLLMVCAFLPYGSDYKGARMFQLAPPQAFGPFARGVYAALCFYAITIPHLLFLAVFVWTWGLWHTTLFAAYSLVVSLSYLAIGLRLVDGVPFSRKPDAARSAVSLPVLMLFGAVVAVAVGAQYYFIFRSAIHVAAAAVIVAVSAFWLTRKSLSALESTMRYNLGLLSAEAGPLYVEIEA